MRLQSRQPIACFFSTVVSSKDCLQAANSTCSSSFYSRPSRACHSSFQQHSALTQANCTLLLNNCVIQELFVSHSLAAASIPAKWIHLSCQQLLRLNGKFAFGQPARLFLAQYNVSPLCLCKAVTRKLHLLMYRQDKTRANFASTGQQHCQGGLLTDVGHPNG